MSAMADRPKVLAGILYSGEPTLSRAIGALEAQQDIDLRIVLIGGFDEWEAHRRLYRTFNETGTDVDMFVKVDADMVIRSERLIAAAFATFRAAEELDQLTINVDDWLSGRSLSGLHVWRGDVRWAESVPHLFTDQVETTVSRKLRIPRSSVSLVSHAPDPSPEQVARFVARRMLKARSVASGRTASRYVDILIAVLEQALLDGASARQIAAAAIELALDQPQEAEEFVLFQQGSPSTLQRLVERTRSDQDLTQNVLDRLVRLKEDGLAGVNPRLSQEVVPQSRSDGRLRKSLGALGGRQRNSEAGEQKPSDESLREIFWRAIDSMGGARSDPEARC